MEGTLRSHVGGRVMTPHALLGRRVKVLAWDDLRDVLPTDPSGTITRGADLGAGDVEVTVRVEERTGSLVFGQDEVQALPGQPAISSDAERDGPSRPRGCPAPSPPA